jgi:osmotically-inducible protein OsmY
MKPTVSDKILRDAVVNELERDPEVNAKHISVTAIDGAITLGGHVAAIHEKHVAVRAAERVPAARAVADDIEVREPSLHERADDEIAEEIAHLRCWGAQIPDAVGAQVRDGRVILHGQVEPSSERDTAERAVRQLTGARVVDNLIEVKPPTEPTATDVAPLTGTFTGPLELPDGTVIEPTGKAFEVMFSTIARSRPLRSSLAAVAPGLGVASLAFALWYGAAAWALAPYPF